MHRGREEGGEKTGARTVKSISLTIENLLVQCVCVDDRHVCMCVCVSVCLCLSAKPKYVAFVYYVRRKVRFRTILGFSCVNLGS